MKLRTLTGTRYEARCADGCGATIPASPDVKVVVDFDSRPRKTWIPAHSPDAGTWKRNGGNGHAEPAPGPTNGGSGGFAPASALPVAPPKAPEPPKAPARPPPLALLGSDASHGEEEAPPSPQAGRAWSSGGLTVNAGKFESVRAGYADYALSGETAEQLGVRVNAVIEADLRAKLAILMKLHREFGLSGAEHLQTHSPAVSAGAPKGASAPSSPPRMIIPSATPAVEEASPGLRPSAVGVGGGTPPSRDGPSVADLVARVNLELSDTSIRRKRAKESAVRRLCELRGLPSLRQASSADESALQALVGIMDSINDWDLHAALGVPAPQLGRNARSSRRSLPFLDFRLLGLERTLVPKPQSRPADVPRFDRLVNRLRDRCGWAKVQEGHLANAVARVHSSERHEFHRVDERSNIAGINSPGVEGGDGPLEKLREHPTFGLLLRSRLESARPVV